MSDEGVAGRWLQGAAFSIFIDRDPDVVFGFLSEVEQTPLWRDHLDEVMWMDDGDMRVGRRMRVITTLGWYRKVEMICEVTAWEPQDHHLAYQVVEGPAHTVNAYRVRAERSGSRFEMQGALRLDSLYIRLAGPLLKRMEDRIARREVERLKQVLEHGPSS